MSKNTKSASKKSLTKTTSKQTPDKLAAKPATTDRAKAIKAAAEEKKATKTAAHNAMVEKAFKVLAAVEIPVVVAPEGPATTVATSEPAAPVTASKPRVEPIPKLKASTLESPSKAVWEIADTMLAANPEVRRVDVVRACVAKGIALNTAKTQFQRWFTAKKA